MSRTRQSVTRAFPELLCFVLAAAFIAQLFTFYRTYSAASASTVGRLAPSGHQSMRQGFADLLGAHLFGLYESSDSQPVDPAVVLTLTGTFSTADPGAGSAIIAAAPGQAGVYPVGAILPNGASLYAVYVDRVLVSANGTTTTLMLPRLLRAGVAGLETLANNPDSEGAAEGPAAASVPGVTEEEIRDQSNGQLWFHSFIAQPVYKKGAYAGMGFNPNLAYQQDYGIKPGDMLTAINGLPVERPGDVDKLLHKVKGGTVTLSIERDGAPMTFTLKVDGP